MKKIMTSVTLMMCIFCNYLLGDETPPVELSIEQETEAAEGGDAKAQRRLGMRYLQGDSVEKDVDKAFEWIKKAARTGEMLYDDVKKAIEPIQKEAEQGNAEAQYNLALCYLRGFGIWPDGFIIYHLNLKPGEPIYHVQRPDLKTPVELLKKAVTQGHVAAKYELGMRYKFTAKEEAFELFKQAAEQENTLAQYELAMCFHYGMGVEKDEAMAVQWYKKAADQGNQLARSQFEQFQETHEEANE